MSDTTKESPTPPAAAKGQDLPRFGAFDKPETAVYADGGRIYEIEGVKKNDAFLHEDRNGKLSVYVSNDFKDYRDLAERINGHKASSEGRDVDHVASRTMEAKLGQRYVLLAAVERGANRSAGSIEKDRFVHRRFNHHATGSVHAGGHGIAKEVSTLQKAKLSGSLRKDYELSRDVTANEAKLAEMRYATFRLPEQQASLRKMKGQEIVVADRDKPAISAAEPVRADDLWKAIEGRKKALSAADTTRERGIEAQKSPGPKRR